MRDPDATLEAIDDVITWYGSDDAMVWTAEPRLESDLSTLASMMRVEPDAALRMLDGAAAAVRAFHEAFRPVAEAMARGFAEMARSPAMQQLAAFANSPEGRALVEAQQRGGIEPHLACNCLCGPRHGDQAACEGEAVGTRRYETPSTGAVDVPMCQPCLDFERTSA